MSRWNDRRDVEVPCPSTLPQKVSATWDDEPPQPCRWKAALNRQLLALAQQRHGFDDSTMSRLLARRDRIAADYRSAWGDRTPPADEIEGLAERAAEAFRLVADGKA